MKYLDLPRDQLRDLFTRSLLKTNRGFSFYVDWRNAEAYKPFEAELRSLDALIGAENFDRAFTELLEANPSVAGAFPLLFALSRGEREDLSKGKGSLLVANSSSGADGSLEFTFPSEPRQGTLSPQLIQLYLLFFERMGLKHLYTNLLRSSTVDYCIGVLVGLDSNGRKNRGGKAFELVCEPLIREVAARHGLDFLGQTQFKELGTRGVSLSADIRERKADFLLLKEGKALNIEVNYFDAQGSKPEETIESYIQRQTELAQLGISFAYLTDGQCWADPAKSQLQRAFRALNYIMNLSLAKNGMLDEVVSDVFGD